jgi:2-succinyl-6-hydroxy-2,4-cyclohexadiene-1-carboxylate synthase
MPVTLIAGERDQKFCQIAERMSERLPSVRVQIVAGAGHAVHLERPDRVGEIIAAP